MKNYGYVLGFSISTLPACGECLLSAADFSNSLDPDQARQNVGLIWIQNVLHFWGKTNFEKKLADQKIMKNYLACKEFVH